ncbi:hypothetical protein ATE84_4970 [Aquimarina sp. MAR_2010_214]|uniref:hypothetical protein n=1 Tax=Aquimarina sp. MAR_2010_214 TaxID=1250026 RepID=UPI000C70B113|nr:hypothetical protein [Aquimarina sp. MAR_2010_214]PKV52842.1 hypothetical protein ATE84_4970 [Aquimarina sp. MAR_2010_214]
MQIQTITTNYLKTIDWFDNKVVDWNSAGTQYLENGETIQLQKYHFGFECDSSITSQNGKYVLIYQKLGTKGLLLKNGELLREINRSYYQSSVYEFPAAFLTYKNRTFLVHCPIQYNQLDIEDVETGEIITNTPEREPLDVFHSRLEISPDNKYILSKGWYWHPFDGIELFDVEKCFSNPKLLDESRTVPGVTSEICSASFVDNNRILVCASNEEPLDDENEEPIPPGHIAIWDITTDTISKSVKIKGPFGNVFAIDDKTCWDLYEYPKIIDLTSGEIIDKHEEVFSGKQASSIIHHLDDLPKIAFNKQTKQIAIGHKNKIEILTK